MIEGDHLEGFKRKVHNMHPIPQTENFKLYKLNEALIDPMQYSIVPAQRSRTHFPVWYSQEFENKVPKKINTSVSKEYVERGKKSIPLPKRDDTPKPEGVRSFPYESQRRGVATNAVDLGSKKVVKNKDGIPYARVIGAEQYDMEGCMNRKQRVTTLIDMRNGLPVKNPGDKYYHDADREPGFYSKGGIIPGSTIQLRKSAKPTIKKSEDVSSILTKSVTKERNETYAEKTRRLANEYEMHQVHVLTQESSSLGQKQPSWEARTGLFLVKPEDELD